MNQLSRKDLHELHELLLEDFGINSRSQMQILVGSQSRQLTERIDLDGPIASVLVNILNELNRSGDLTDALANVQSVSGWSASARSQKKLSEYRLKLSSKSADAKSSFMLVLLQRIDAPSLYFAPIMAAFEDVERLFAKLYPQQVSFERRYLAPSLPTDELRHQPRLDWARTEQLLKTDEWWGGPRARVLRIDQRMLLPRVRELVKAGPDQQLVVAVGANIRSTNNTSFGLWDVLDDRDAVIALNPMNPHFWGITVEEGRMERVKITARRVRAATCAVVGRLRGIQPCSNPECFLLREPMQSVDQLDEMRMIGPEHEVDGVIDSSLVDSTDFAGDFEDAL